MDNGHIRSTPRAYDNVQGGFRFRYKNEGGVSLLDFTKSAWVRGSQFEFLKGGGTLGNFL